MGQCRLVVKVLASCSARNGALEEVSKNLLPPYCTRKLLLGLMIQGAFRLAVRLSQPTGTQAL